MKDKQKKAIMLIIACVIAYIFPFVFSGQAYVIMIASYIFMYAIVTSGLDVLFGYCGQISFGHAAFFCIGAYVSACLNRYLGWPVLLTMLLGAIAATIVGALIAWPSTKLVYHFLSLSTIAFAAVVNQIVRVSPGGITGNAVGFKTSPIIIFGINFSKNPGFYLFALTILILVLITKQNLTHSRIGRAFLAIRENSHAANGMGINVRLYKVMAFATSAFCAGYAGSMYTHLLSYIVPDQFKQTMSALFVTMLMFGGSGNIVGPIIGVIGIQLLTEGTRFVEGYQMLIYGSVLLLVILLFPGGIYGVAKGIGEKYLGKIKTKIFAGKSKTGGQE